MTAAEITVFLVDDHPSVLSGLEHALQGQRAIRVAGKANSATALWDMLASQPCDVLVSDYPCPVVNPATARQCSSACAGCTRNWASWCSP